MESNDEDGGTVKERANLNKGSASDTPRWPSIRPRVARLRKEVQTLKKTAREVARDAVPLATWTEDTTT